MPSTPSFGGRVLAGVEGRAGGRDANALALALAAPGAPVTLGHVWDWEPVLDVDRSAAAAELLEAERRRWPVPLEVAATGERRTLEGLRQLVARTGADLVVLGASHHGALDRLVLGDLGRAAIHRLAVPVAIAPRGAADAPAHPLRRIGVGWGGSPAAEAALAAARELADRVGATVHVCAAVVPATAFAAATPVAPVLAAAGEAGVLDRVRREVAGLGDDAGRAAVGDPAEVLRRFADEVDLLVLGARRTGRLRRMLLGSPVDALAHHAPCPVLVVPADGPQAGPGAELPVPAGAPA
jgi:nucleotide-binding universal stress UspA family protein